jgi:cell division protein FtsB
MKHMRQNNSPWWRRFLRSRLMLAVDLVLLGFVGWSLSNEVAQGNKVSSDLNDLQTQIAALQKQNQDYGAILSQMGTPGFVDKEARLKLGYQKPGEQVLLLEDGAAAPLASVPADTDVSGLSNPQKWWHYFFGGS